MAKQGFTVPKLHDCGGDLKKEWYVSFRYTDPLTGKRKPFPHRRGLNYCTTRAERYEEGKELKSLLHDALKDGWNPFNQSIEDFLAQPPDSSSMVIHYDDDLTKMPLCAALEFAYNKKLPNLADPRNYNCVKTFAIRAAKNLSMDTMPIGKLSRKHVKMLLDQMQKDRQKDYDEQYEASMKKYRNKGRFSKMKEPVRRIFSGNNYNKYKEFLHMLLTEIEEYEALEYNPASKISDRPETKHKPHRHASVAEERLIKTTLKERHLRLYVFLAFIELAELRPKEILGLKIRDIDWFNGWFDVWPTDGRSKTREARKTAIPNTLVPLIRELRLENNNPEDYIFSHALHPGPLRLKRDKVTKVWNKIVHRDLGLTVTLYSFKGLGGDKKRAAGIDKNAVSSQMGHTKLTTTDIYLEREEERQRRVIREFTPSFDNL